MDTATKMNTFSRGCIMLQYRFDMQCQNRLCTCSTVIVIELQQDNDMRITTNTDLL